MLNSDGICGVENQTIINDKLSHGHRQISNQGKYKETLNSDSRVPTKSPVRETATQSQA